MRFRRPAAFPFLLLIAGLIAMQFPLVCMIEPLAAECGPIGCVMVCRGEDLMLFAC